MCCFSVHRTASSVVLLFDAYHIHHVYVELHGSDKVCLALNVHVFFPPFYNRNTLDAINGHQPAIDVVLHAGDLSYADCEQVRLSASSSAADTAVEPPPRISVLEF